MFCSYYNRPNCPKYFEFHHLDLQYLDLEYLLEKYYLIQCMVPYLIFWLNTLLMAVVLLCLYGVIVSSILNVIRYRGNTVPSMLLWLVELQSLLCLWEGTTFCGVWILWHSNTAILTTLQHCNTNNVIGIVIGMGTPASMSSVWVYS